MHTLVGRAAQVVALAVLVWMSIKALASSESGCPGKVVAFVAFILASSLAQLALFAWETARCHSPSESMYVRRTALSIALALLLGLVGQLYILGACDRPLHDVTQLFVALQYAIVGWDVPALAVMLWIVAAEPAAPALARVGTPRPSPESELRDAFDGDSPVLTLDLGDV